MSLRLRICPSTMLSYSTAVCIEVGPETPILEAYSKVAWEKYNILKEKKIETFFLNVQRTSFYPWHNFQQILHR